MDKISTHISYEEAVNSPTAKAKGISNEPTLEHLKAMVTVAVKCFEPVRRWVGKPLRINSFYRSATLNKAVGGSATSEHCKGEAIDISGMGNITNAKIFHFLKENVEFSQLIAEFPDANGEPQWVHISHSEKGNKGQILVASKVNGVTKYSQYKRGDISEI